MDIGVESPRSARLRLQFGGRVLLRCVALTSQRRPRPPTERGFLTRAADPLEYHGMSSPETKVVIVRRGCTCCGCGWVLSVPMLPLLLLPTLAWGRRSGRSANNQTHQTRLSSLAIRIIEAYRRRLSGRLRIQC